MYLTQIGGNSERANIDVVTTICDLVDEMCPEAGEASRRRLITFVEDRPGHDRRYLLDCTKIRTELGWELTVAFEEGLADTVRWYAANRPWWEPLRDRAPVVETSWGDGAAGTSAPG